MTSCLTHRGHLCGDDMFKVPPFQFLFIYPMFFFFCKNVTSELTRGVHEHCNVKLLISLQYINVIIRVLAQDLAVIIRW